MHDHLSVADITWYLLQTDNENYKQTKLKTDEIEKSTKESKERKCFDWRENTLYKPNIDR